MNTTVGTETQPQPAAAAPVGISFNMTPAVMIEKYIALRSKIDDIMKAQSKQLAPYRLALAQLEAGILGALNTAGVKNMKCEAGTAFTTTRTSATVREWSKTLDYIRDNGAWELLEARVSKTAVLAIMDETGTPIPGVNVSQELTLNVRRA